MDQWYEMKQKSSFMMDVQSARPRISLTICIATRSRNRIKYLKLEMQRCLAFEIVIAERQLIYIICYSINWLFHERKINLEISFVHIQGRARDLCVSLTFHWRRQLIPLPKKPWTCDPLPSHEIHSSADMRKRALSERVNIAICAEMKSENY